MLDMEQDCGTIIDNEKNILLCSKITIIKYNKN